MKHSELVAKFKNREAVIGTVGLGYVGLPLVLTYGSKGFKKLGFDIDSRRVDEMAG